MYKKRINIDINWLWRLKNDYLYRLTQKIYQVIIINHILSINENFIL